MKHRSRMTAPPDRQTSLNQEEPPNNPSNESKGKTRDETNMSKTRIEHISED